MKQGKKFQADKPLIYWKKYKSKNYILHYANFNGQKTLELTPFVMGEKIKGRNTPYIFGILVSPEAFGVYDFLHTYDGPAFVVHDRVLRVFQDMCPDDFQRFDMVIKNSDPDSIPFENHEFHLINVTNRIQAFDMEKSEFHKSPNGILFPTKRVFKDGDCWEGHLLAREALESSILFHPKLAKKFRRSKGIQFLTDTEAPC